MHYFRAFAIVNVVLVHVWCVPKKISEDPCFINTMSEVLFHDSTIYFIFISGFLFHYLSYKFQLLKYYKSKVLNVILPYVIVSSAVFLLQLASCGVKGGGEWEQLSVSCFMKGLLQGTHQPQFWYIPFIAIVFLVSPLLLKIGNRAFVVATLGMLLLPLLGTRTTTQLTIGQYVYFFPVYCFGIVCSMHYDAFLSVCRRYFHVFLALSLATTAALLFLYSRFDYGQNVNVYESVYYIQKMAILMVTVHLLQSLKHRKIHWLDVAANYSFAIYFLHYLVYRTSWQLLHSLFPSHGTAFWSVVFTLLPGLILVLLVVGIHLAKRVLKGSSRMVIGA